MASNQVVVTVEDASGKEVRRVTTSFPGQHEFNNLPPGKYKAYVYFPDGRKAEAAGDDTLSNSGTLKVSLIERKINLPASSPSPKKPIPNPEGRPPWKVIIPSAVSISLLSNFGGAEPLFRAILRQLDVPPPRPSPQTQPPNNQPPPIPSPHPPSSQFFSPAVEARLRECILSNLVRLADIPTLSGLLASANWDRDPFGDFEQQLLFWYVTVGELQATIDACDPTLTQQVIAASERYRAPESVIVTGELVNVRVGSSVNEAVLDRVPKGTVLSVDRETEINLSFDQRLAIEQGIGWQPVFLPDGRRGYIYSLYVTAQTSP